MDCLPAAHSGTHSAYIAESQRERAREGERFTYWTRVAVCGGVTKVTRKKFACSFKVAITVAFLKLLLQMLIDGKLGRRKCSSRFLVESIRCRAREEKQY